MCCDGVASVLLGYLTANGIEGDILDEDNTRVLERLLATLRNLVARPEGAEDLTRDDATVERVLLAIRRVAPARRALGAVAQRLAQSMPLEGVCEESTNATDESRLVLSSFLHATATLSYLRRFADDRATQIWGLGLLQRIAQQPDGRVALAEADGVDWVLRQMVALAEDQVAVERALGCIWQLSFVAAAATRLREHELRDSAIKAAQSRFPRAVRVQERVQTLLFICRAR
jgi:hypothetical protein